MSHWAENHRASAGPAFPALAAAFRDERSLFLLGTGFIALHGLDDSFLQPQPGTSAADHLLSGLVHELRVVAFSTTRSSAMASVRSTQASMPFGGLEA